MREEEGRGEGGPLKRRGGRCVSYIVCKSLHPTGEPHWIWLQPALSVPLLSRPAVLRGGIQWMSRQAYSRVVVMKAAEEDPQVEMFGKFCLVLLCTCSISTTFY